MLKLKRMSEFRRAEYHGFTLRPDYWYGVDTKTGKYIATSGWEFNRNVAIYFKSGKNWDMDWVSIDDEEFELENIPIINTSGKMNFQEYLREKIGISYHEYDENCGDNDEAWEEYQSYLHDDWPRFVWEYIEAHK